MKPLPLVHHTRLSLLALAMGLSAVAEAAPSGGVVRGGAGTIEQADLTTTINQSSTRLAIDWNSFDVGSDETVRFIQPGSTAVALNRVLSNEFSSIAGRISANGQVVLVNPNGIFFAEGAQVDVGGLVAAGLDVDPNAFMDGEIILQNPGVNSAGVSNRGIIRAAAGGNVALLGTRVVNAGSIDAHLGSVELASGSAMVLTFEPDGLLGVRVTAGAGSVADDASGAVINSGDITASGGRVTLSAVASSEVFSSAVNAGAMVGDTVVAVHDDGSFSLGPGGAVVNSGSVDASIYSGGDLIAAGGGAVRLSGRTIAHTGSIRAAGRFDEGGVDSGASQVSLHASDGVAIAEGAEVSADGFLFDGTSIAAGDISIDAAIVEIGGDTRVSAAGRGGGTINIGGGATHVSIGEGVLIDVAGDMSEYGGGAGGQIVLAGQETLNVEGRLNARGGFNGAAGSVSMFGGSLRFRGAAHVGGGQIEEADTLPAGTVTFESYDLRLSNADASTGDAGVALGGARVIGDVELIGRHSLAVASGAPVVLGRRGSYSFRTEAQDGSSGLMDLTGLLLEAGDGLDTASGSSYRFNAAGNLIAPESALPLDLFSTPRHINFQFTSSGGDILHRGNLETFGGNYSAVAAGSVSFSDTATLHLARSSSSYNGSANIEAGADIALNLMASALAPVNGDATLTATGGEVFISAPQGLPSAVINASSLVVDGGGQLLADVNATASTRLTAAALSDWQLGGHFGELSGVAGSNSHIAVAANDELALGNFKAVDSSISFDATGPDSLIYQVAATQLRASRSQLNLRADNIDLGADGSSQVQLFDGSNSLAGFFTDQLRLSGVIQGRSSSDRLVFTGDGGDNTVAILSGARLESRLASFASFRLGAGADLVTIAAPGSYSLRLDEGADTVVVNGPDIDLTLLDFNPAEDQLLQSAP